jgi:hypothetical protein
MMRASL